MKLVAVLGSARNNSVSNKIARKVIEGAEAKSFQTAVYHVNDMSIKGCRGCGACRKNGTDCIIQDDMQQYYKELRECDVLLVASPNYYSQITGPMITFLNRHYCMTGADANSRLGSGKKIVGIFAQGAPQEMKRYEENYDWYLSCFQRHMELAGKIVAGGNSDLSAGGKIMTEAYELGKTL